MTEISKMAACPRNERSKRIKRMLRSHGAVLPVPVTPRADEGFADLLTRAATENGYISRTPILKYLCKPYVYETWAQESALKLDLDPDLASDFLGNDGGSEQLKALMDRPGLLTVERPLMFFGAALSRWHATSGRRVSPRALRNDLYLRAVWRIRSLSFDPDTKELLLNKCPECHAVLHDRTTVGLQYCEVCAVVRANGSVEAVDLRDFPQEILPSELWRNLDFVSGLIDPRNEKQHGSMSCLPPDFRNCTRSAVYEIVTYLATRLAPRPAAHIPPENLSIAADSVVLWPEGFERYVEIYTAARRSRARGKPLDDISLLYGTRYLQSVPSPVAEAMKFMLKVGTSGGYSARGSVGQAIIQSKIAGLLDQHREIESVDDLPAFRELANELGLPLTVVFEMMLQECGSNDTRTRARETQWLLNARWRIRSIRSTRTARLQEGIRLDRAVSAIWQRPANPWGGLLLRLSDQSLPASIDFHSSETVKQTYVNMADLHRVLGSDRAPEWIFTAIPFSKTEFRSVSGLNSRMFELLRKNGLVGQELSRAHLHEFRTKYVLTGEIADRWLQRATKRLFYSEICDRLVRQNIHPLVTCGCQQVWHRAEVEDELGNDLVPVLQ